MRVLILVLYTLTLRVVRDDSERTFRWQIAVAIDRGTSDDDEQRVLARLGWLEGWYSRDVARCAFTGKQGELGLFQVKPRDPSERKMACGSLDQQVALALRFIRRSREVCAALGFKPHDQLSLYTTGHCMNNREARNRWGEPFRMTLGEPANDNEQAALNPAASF